MSSALALLAALCFALAATLQQKGSIGMEGVVVSIRHPGSLARLAQQRWWLAGTAVLLVAYGLQAAALDRGRLAIVQPLLVTTVVFALPLGWLLTGQRVGRRELVGSGVILAGLAVFAGVGDPAGGRADAPDEEWAIAIAIIAVLCVAILAVGLRGTVSLTRRAAVYGTVAGILFGLSATLVKPATDILHTEGISAMLESWRAWGVVIAGLIALVLQQVSLGSGRLAPSVATVSVANPAVATVLGVTLLDERLEGPALNAAIATAGLVAALAGAVIISLAHERDAPVPQTSPTKEDA
jgi:drug/metabolite transporter (DMT)-like permease